MNATAKPCSIENCNRPVLARGWCRTHYGRWRVHGTPHFKSECLVCGSLFEPAPRKHRCDACISGGCSVPKCTRPVWSRGWCGVHYARWRSYGDPTHVVSRKCAACGGVSTFTGGTGRGKGSGIYCSKCRGETVSEYRAFLRKRYVDKIRAHRRQWYLKNREHALTYARQYILDNPGKRKVWMDANRDMVRQWTQRRRARIKGNGTYVVTPRDLSRALARHDHACAYCRCPLTPKTITWDHIIPISRGGRHSIGNLAPACKPCNSAKRDRSSYEWRLYLLKSGEVSRMSLL